MTAPKHSAKYHAHVCYMPLPSTSMSCASFHVVFPLLASTTARLKQMKTIATMAEVGRSWGVASPAHPGLHQCCISGASDGCGDGDVRRHQHERCDCVGVQACTFSAPFDILLTRYQTSATMGAYHSSTARACSPPAHLAQVIDIITPHQCKHSTRATHASGRHFASPMHCARVMVKEEGRSRLACACTAM